MEPLRWLLLLFGLLVIAGVYIYSRREKSKPVDAEPIESPGVRVEPTLGDDADEPDGSPAIAEDEPPEPSLPEAPQKIVTLRLVGRDKKPFPGDELILSMRGIGLRHGKFGIFHRYDGNDESRPYSARPAWLSPAVLISRTSRTRGYPGSACSWSCPGRSIVSRVSTS